MDSLAVELKRPEVAPSGFLPIEAFLGMPLPKDFVLPEGDVKFLERVDMEQFMIERAPFYFIDKAVAVGKDLVLATAEMTEERCAGHFPGRPIVPLIELCKAMAQSGMILASLNSKPEKLAPVAIASGPSKAIANDLIDAPTTILIVMEFEQIVRPGMRFLVKGAVFTKDEPIGTLTGIEYLMLPRTRLLRRRVA